MMIKTVKVMASVLTRVANGRFIKAYRDENCAVFPGIVTFLPELIK